MARSDGREARIRSDAIHAALKVHFRSGRRADDFCDSAEALVRWCQGDPSAAEALRICVDLTPVADRETLLVRAGQIRSFLAGSNPPVKPEAGTDGSGERSNAPRESGAARKKRSARRNA